MKIVLVAVFMSETRFCRSLLNEVSDRQIMQLVKYILGNEHWRAIRNGMRPVLEYIFKSGGSALDRRDISCRLTETNLRGNGLGGRVIAP